MIHQNEIVDTYSFLNHRACQLSEKLLFSFQFSGKLSDIYKSLILIQW